MNLPLHDIQVDIRTLNRYNLGKTIRSWGGHMGVEVKVTRVIQIVLCFMPLFIIPYTIDYFYLPKVALVLMAVLAVMVIQLVNRKKLPRSRMDRTELWAGIYCLLVSVSVIFTQELWLSIIGSPLRWEGLMVIYAYILLFIFAKRYFMLSERILAAFILSSVLISVYGIFQYFGFDPLPRDIYRENWSGRAFATIGNPNFLGTYQVLALPVSLFCYLHSRQSRFLFATCLIYFGLLSTSSRGPWIGALAAVLCLSYSALKLGYSVRHLIISYAGMAVVTVLFGMFGHDAFLSRIVSVFIDFRKLVLQTTDSETAGSFRIFIWVRVLDVIKHNPVWGVGLETLDLSLTREYGNEIRSFFGYDAIVDKAHNEYLHIAATCGIPALIAYLSFVSTTVNNGYRQIKTNPLILPLFCSVIGYLVQAFFNISIVAVAPIFWIFLGVLAKPAPVSVLSSEHIRESPHLV